MIKFNMDEKNSFLWKRIQQHMQDEIDVLRCRNDGPHDPIATAVLRGRIMQAKEFIKMADDSHLDAGGAD